MTLCFHVKPRPRLPYSTLSPPFLFTQQASLIPEEGETAADWGCCSANAVACDPAAALRAVGRGAWGTAAAQLGVGSGVNEAGCPPLRAAQHRGQDCGCGEGCAREGQRGRPTSPLHVPADTRCSHAARSGKTPLNPFRSASAEDSAKKHEAYVCVLRSYGTYKVSSKSSKPSTPFSALQTMRMDEA